MSSRPEPVEREGLVSAPWVGRVLALGLLIAVLALTYIILIAPLVSAYTQVNGEISQSSELLARYRTISAGSSELEDLLDRINDEHTASGVYLPGDTDALAAARLQEIVNSRVETNGAQVRSVQILPAKEDGDFRRVGVRIQMTASIAAIARILYAFEAGGTYLFVDNLEISNRRSRKRKELQTNPQLLVRLDLTGYVRPETEK